VHTTAATADVRATAATADVRATAATATSHRTGGQGRSCKHQGQRKGRCATHTEFRHHISPKKDMGENKVNTGSFRYCGLFQSCDDQVRYGDVRVPRWERLEQFKRTKKIAPAWNETPAMALGIMK
jgi:hypothetical protein